MIGELLPATVAAVETTVDPAGATLFPEESALLTRAVDKRKREFTTVRHCARQAMAALGVPAAPILPGERRAPIWPDGIAGSMTHTAGYRAAALARTSDIVSLGIDAEPHGPLPEGVLDTVSLPAERAWIAASRAESPDVHWDRLLFCAKEAVYKTWFPLTLRWLGFEDAEIGVDVDAGAGAGGASGASGASGAFHARILVEPGVSGDRVFHAFDGRWLVRDGFVLAAIAVPASHPPR
ncbi:4'-phosphopantetheinyl transferase [Amycolatopsis antarctica]|uniref:4'-phosphopantetheinyl transferase n=1 Tax=Amycolatopsis antarctica TaxID=1854586 RepID=A0A263D639_9PSEU|nr:4'-phosphopantetheinyl transferase superfamily protein [Amycolatopsis antarctica]OZM73047.1 4'-phosphopantetheinyl transferase [Amycolatopsis antarctica]